MANGYIGQVRIGSNDYKIGSTLYAVCSDTGQTRTVIINGFAVSTGVTVHIKFEHEYTNTATTPKLKIKSSADDTTAAEIEITNANGPKTWSDNSVIALTLTGTSADNYKWAINSSAIDGSSIQNLSLGQITSAGKITGKASQAVVTNASAEITAIDLTVSEPTANGNSLVFIDTISQNSQGKITATKKTVQNASRTQAGVIKLPDGNTTTKFLREDGSWEVPPDTHHQASLITGASNTAQTTAAGSTNKFFLNLIENNEVRSSHEIVGSGSVTVESNASGKITITGTKSGTVTSITPGNGLINGTSGNSQSAITDNGTISIKEGGITNAMLAGSIENSKLLHHDITIGSVTKDLGGKFELSELGITAAMNFKGTTTTEMEDGRTTAAVTIGGNSYNPNNGDVVLYGGKEYVWTGSIWEQLGDESSWALASAVINKTGATGDLLYWSDTDTPSHLNIGTGNNKFLTINNGVPVWGTVEKSDIGLSNVTNHQQVHEVAWNSSNNTITRSKNNTAGNVVTFAQGTNVTLTATATQLTIAAADPTVTQTGADDNVEYAILLKNTTGAANETNGVKFVKTTDKLVTINPSSGIITAKGFSGDGSSLTNVSVAWGKIDGIPTGAKDTLGVVKTTSTVSATSGLTASPIINGVVYYKDTNSTTHLYINNTASPGTSPKNAAITTTDNAYIHLYDDTTKRDTIQLIGAGGLSITATTAKVITLTSKEYESSGNTDALTSLTLTYNDGTAQTNTVSSTANSAVAVGEVDKGILYIKSIYYGTTQVSTGVQPKNIS